MQQTIPAPELAREQANEMFNRVMRAWVIDLLNIRRNGLDRPRARDLRFSDRQAVRPGLRRR